MPRPPQSNATPDSSHSAGPSPYKKSPKGQEWTKCGPAAVRLLLHDPEELRVRNTRGAKCRRRIRSGNDRRNDGPDKVCQIRFGVGVIVRSPQGTPAQA